VSKSDHSVRRWVLMDKQGRFATDVEGGNFEKGLDEAYIHAGRPRSTVAVTAVAVVVTIAAHSK